MDLKRLVWTDRETESLIDNVRIYKVGDFSFVVHLI